MEETCAKLSEVLFTESELRCAIVMALVHNKETIDSTSILGVKMGTIQCNCKKFKGSKGPKELSQRVITKSPKSLENN